MLVKVFNLRMDLQSMQYDDSVLVQFASEHDVVAMKTQFFFFQEEPIWSVIVTYRNQYRPSALQQSRKVRKTYRNIKQGEVDSGTVTVFNQQAFEALRLWRNETARQIGHPASNLFNNRQLEEIVKMNPTSTNELTKIIGIGKYKSSTYGNEILALLSQHAILKVDSQQPLPKQTDTVSPPSVTDSPPVGDSRSTDSQ